MVRPGRRNFLASASLARVSAEAPGSRPRPSGEIRWVRAGRQKPVSAGSKEAGRNKVNTSASSNYQPKGVGEGRAAHVIAKAIDSRLDSERRLDLSGVGVAARFDRRLQNRRDPTRQPASGKDRAYKAGRLKASGAGRESEGSVVPRKAVKAAGGKGPCLDRACEEVSARACRKRTTTR